MDADAFKSMRSAIIRAAPKEHRDWLGGQLRYSNEPRLKQRLRDLVNFSGQGFNSVVSDRESWFRVVAEIRNRLNHHDEARTLEWETTDLVYLSESVYLLLLLSLFRECGVSDEILAVASGNERVRFLRSQLDDLVPRLAAQMTR